MQPNHPIRLHNTIKFLSLIILSVTIIACGSPANDRASVPLPSVEIDLLNEISPQAIEFQQDGRYRVELFFTHTAQNQPPRSFSDVQFFLIGSFQIFDHNETLSIVEYSKVVSNINSALQLGDFDISGNEVNTPKYISIQFEELDPIWGEYFSNTRLQIRRISTRSFLD